MFFIKISDVERLTGLSAKSIRLYESKKLFNVNRSGNSYREYTEENIENLKKIKLMRELGIAIADIKLWCDGVIDTGALIKKRQKELDDLDKLSMGQKELCREILENGMIQSGAGTSFSDPDLSLPTRSAPENASLSLGIDIGTTSISAQLVDTATGEPIHTYNFDHEAALTIENLPDAYAEDANLLTNRALSLVSSITDAYPAVKSIGITGQMHGIVCLGENNEILSPLYTWQNKFGTREESGGTICEEIRKITGESVPTGYGFTTLYALIRLGLLPEGTVKISTIMDLAAMKLCGNDRVVTHPTNAASLGFYDVGKSEFMRDKLGMLGISENCIPEVSPDYAVVGYYKGIPVSAAIGDNQAGVYGSIRGENQMLINVGTSGQISVLTDKIHSSYGEVRPYFDGKYLLSGSMLCGGKAYAVLAEFYCSVAAMFGVKITKNEAYSQMNRLAEGKPINPLEVSVSFAGTREDDSVRGYIKNIGVENFTPQSLTEGVIGGIIGELYGMYEKMDSGADKIRSQAVVSGNAMRRNPALRKKAAEVFGAELLIPAYNEEAAYGAALYSAVSSGIITRNESCGLIKYE